MTTSTNTLSRFPRLERLAFSAAAVSFIVLALSGLIVAVIGQPLSGFLLLAHTGMGGLFAVSVVVLAILRAEGVSRTTEQQVSFWLLLAASLVLMGTAALMMIPLFGTEGQHALVTIHRYAAWAALLAGLRYAWLERKRQSAK